MSSKRKDKAVQVFIPGRAIEIAEASDVGSKTAKTISKGERRKKGRGWRLYAEVSPEVAEELITVLDQWLDSDGPHGIAESQAVKTAIERLEEVSGNGSSSHERDEKRTEAKRRSAQEKRLKTLEAKRQKITEYEEATAHWLSNYKTLPTPQELQDRDPKDVEKLNKLVAQEQAATDRVKQLYSERGKITRPAATAEEADAKRIQDRLDAKQAEIEIAIEERNEVRLALKDQRGKMAGKDALKLAHLKVPQPEDFGLVKKDVV